MFKNCLIMLERNRQRDREKTEVYVSVYGRAWHNISIGLVAYFSHAW